MGPRKFPGNFSFGTQNVKRPERLKSQVRQTEDGKKKCR